VFFTYSGEYENSLFHLDDSYVLCYQKSICKDRGYSVQLYASFYDENKWNCQKCKMPPDPNELQLENWCVMHAKEGRIKEIKMSNKGSVQPIIRKRIVRDGIASEFEHDFC